MFRGCVLAVVAMVVIGSSALADIPGPGRRTLPPEPIPQVNVAPTKATVAVKVQQADLDKEGKGVRAKIAIPRKVLARVAPGTAALDAATDEQHAALPWWSTVIAGIAMSAGAVGLIFAARGSKTTRVVGTAAVVAAAMAGGYAFADIRIPERDRPLAVGESIVLEIVEDGDIVVLTLPPD